MTESSEKPLSPSQIAVRLAVTLLGTFVMALGIALAKHAAVGTTPISCLPAVLYNFFSGLGLPVTLGLFTFLMNAGFLVGEVLLLRRRFPAAQLLQLPQVLVFSLAVDLWMGWVVPALPLATPVHHYALLLVSMLTIALGIQLQLMGDTIVTPPEAFIGIVARRLGRPYGDVKVGFDVGFLVSGAVLSLLLMGGLTDVREGTVLAAVGVGFAIKGWNRLLRPLARRLPQGPTPLPPLP